MAIQLSVTQFGGKVFVYANNTSSDHVAYIDYIILLFDTELGSWGKWFYQDDFYFGSGRLGEGSGARMVEFNYPGGPASAHATAKYWEVDQSAKSLPVNVS